MIQINELRDCCFEMTTDRPISASEPHKLTWPLFVSRLRRELFQPIGSSKRSAKR